MNGTYLRFDGHNVAAGWALDGVFANAISPTASGASNFSGIVLPTVFDVAAAVEHYWTPALRTSVFGSVTGWEAGAAEPLTPGGIGSMLNNIMCSRPVGPVRTSTSGAPNFFTGGVLGLQLRFGASVP